MLFIICRLLDNSNIITFIIGAFPFNFKMITTRNARFRFYRSCDRCYGQINFCKSRFSSPINIANFIKTHFIRDFNRKRVYFRYIAIILICPFWGLFFNNGNKIISTGRSFPLNLYHGTRRNFSWRF